MNVRPAILIIENQKVLTMQYRYGEQDVYNLPGGNLELFERMAETLERELEEELNLSVEVGKMLMIGEVIFEKQQKSTLHAIFEGKIKAGSPVLNPKETSAKAIVWLPLADLRAYNMYPNVADAILKLQGEGLESPYLGRIPQEWF